MGAEVVFEKFSLREKTAIMAVLSRDRQLRETEEERVMKLRIDLAKERRGGALVAGKESSQKKRTCARCRGDVGILQSARCPMCKHIVCKNCRVERKDTMSAIQSSAEMSDKGEQKQLSPDQLSGVMSNSSYPAELNPFESDPDIPQTSNMYTSTPVGAKWGQNSEHSSLEVPTIHCEVIDDVEDDFSDVIPTSFDPNLGRSLVGGDTGNMTLPENLCNDSDIYYHNDGPRRYSDLTHIKAKRRGFQKSGNSGLIISHQNNLRRKLFDNNLTSSSSKSSHSRNSLINIPSHGARLTIGEDSDERHAHSDSSAYVTAVVSPQSHPQMVTNGGELGLPKKSNSTGYLPDFDEKGAVEFLMQIGKKYDKKMVESSPDTEESADDIQQCDGVVDVVDTVASEGSTSFQAVENMATEEVETPKLEKQKPTRRNPISMLSTALEVIAKDFSNENILSKPPINPLRKTSLSSFLSRPIVPKISSNEVVAKFKGLLTLKGQNKQENTVDKNKAEKLFRMASNSGTSIPTISTNLTACEQDSDDLSKEVESITKNMSENHESANENELRVVDRQWRSNPNSPFRKKKDMLFIGADDGSGCMSEGSAQSEEEGAKISSSSDAPSTSSSEEYYYVRPKLHPSIKPHPPVKDSGYSTRETYLKSRNRSKFIRATRLSRRARERERDLRRLGKKALRDKLSRDFIYSRRDTSSDLSDIVKPDTPVLIEPEDNGAMSANTNIMGHADAEAPGPTTPRTISGDNIEKSLGAFTLPMRKSSGARRLFQQLSIRLRSRSLTENWVCKVCDKSLDVRKKSGDWFYKTARPEVLQFKEHLVNTKRQLSGDAPIVLHMTAQPMTFKPAVAEESSTLLLLPPTRMRSNTLPCDLNHSNSGLSGMRKSPSTTSLAEQSVEMSQLEANMQRQRLRIGRKSVAEVLHGTLLFDVPDPQPAGAPPPFVKKQSSLVEKTIAPATIKDGPEDVIIIRGNPISLCCALAGTPPLKSVWRKGKNEIQSSNQCCLDITDNSASLTIKKSERDDSGCYILQVKNTGGVDQYSINVSVVDVPDPPGQPYASDIAGNSLVVSWYGTGYDGGSTITGYRVEMADVTSSPRLPKWSSVALAKSTSCSVQDLKPNARYVFRICAENKHGISKPGQQSDVILNTTTDVAESSEDEETFVKHGTVTVKTDGSFAERYETKERLGQGRFGKVHRVVDRVTGKEYAAKIMRALKAKDKEAVQQEIDVMNCLRHPRLVQLIDAYSHGREITMVMDLVSGGELFERVIDEDFELTEAACIKYMSQICDGLKYMHDALILHLDLKPENIMCINKTGTQIKIIDFGLARKYNPKETIRVMFGTPEFVAPEVINYDAIGPQTDMWSVGVICYILLSGLSPFMGDNDAETLGNITAVEWDFDDESFDDISHDAKDFIKQLLVKNLKKRYTVDKAIDHKWLKRDTNKMAERKLNTRNLKRFLARRKWQKTGNAVRALGRLASLANIGSPKANPNKISNGQPRESGFLAALKAQLLRDNEEEQDGPTNCKPIFETLFDDVEVIEGSAAKFECTIIGTPDPEIMWYKDGEPIKESRHFRISYTEEDLCTLLITDATEADEAEYTCKAVNCEGETEHRAELIVITPGV